VLDKRENRTPLRPDWRTRASGSGSGDDGGQTHKQNMNWPGDGLRAGFACILTLMPERVFVFGQHRDAILPARSARATSAGSTACGAGLATSCVGYLTIQASLTGDTPIRIHLLGTQMDKPSSHHNDLLASSIGEGID
jgi:hypothetical protein